MTFDPDQLSKSSLKKNIDSLKSKIRKLNDQFAEDAEELRSFETNEMQITDFIRDLNNKNKELSKKIELKKQRGKRSITNVEASNKEVMQRLTSRLEGMLTRSASLRRKIEDKLTDLGDSEIRLKNELKSKKEQYVTCRHILHSETLILSELIKRQNEVIIDVLTNREPNTNENILKNETNTEIPIMDDTFEIERQDTDALMSCFKHQLKIAEQREQITKQITALKKLKKQLESQLV